MAASPRVLGMGSQGPDVREWQAFLATQGLLRGEADGIFGPATRDATFRFQQARSLTADGRVGPKTRQAAGRLGMDAPPAPANAVPARPSFGPITTTAQREALFGRFEFRPRPTASNPEAIEILDGWATQQMVQVDVPQLRGVPYGWGGACNGKLRFHRRAAAQLQALWKAWESQGLLDRVLTFDGGYTPRLMRGSTHTLSSHAFGSAFDINAQWNGLGRTPAAANARGCVLELVSIANEHGFYWGGHFAGRKDGMHFEVARLL